MNQPVGPGDPITVSYAGNAFYLPATATASATIFYLNGLGAFVIGDRSAVIGATVNFWGAQWAKNNSFSGGSAPASMKGFRGTSPTALCGGTWTTDPGNSSDPPPAIPGVMYVIVSSKVTKSGSTISGDIEHVAAVQVSPEYDPNPGHAGNGKVIAIVC